MAITKQVVKVIWHKTAPPPRNRSIVFARWRQWMDGWSKVLRPTRPRLKVGHSETFFPANLLIRYWKPNPTKLTTQNQSDTPICSPFNARFNLPAHASHYLKRHLDRFMRFCTTHLCAQHRHTDRGTCDSCSNLPHLFDAYDEGSKDL